MMRWQETGRGEEIFFEGRNKTVRAGVKDDCYITLRGRTIYVRCPSLGPIHGS
jgi:hypothetical protein